MLRWRERGKGGMEGGRRRRKEGREEGMEGEKGRETSAGRCLH